MNERDDQHWCTALHEAAHCVVAHEFGAPIFNVTNDAAPAALIGGVKDILFAWQRSGDYRKGDTRRAADAKICICLAGPIGQRIHGSEDDGGVGDRIMIDEFSRRFDVSDARIARLERKTRKILLARWAAVIKLAAALMDAGALSRGEIATILER
jgi:hypothetical protein